MTEVPSGICGLRVEINSIPVFICTEPLDHGGRLHRNPGATYDEVDKELRRGVDVTKGKST